METKLFQLLDNEGENIGLYTSKTKDANDLQDLSSEHRENALEAMEEDRKSVV